MENNKESSSLAGLHEHISRISLSRAAAARVLPIKRPNVGFPDENAPQAEAYHLVPLPPNKRHKREALADILSNIGAELNDKNRMKGKWPASGDTAGSSFPRHSDKDRVIIGDTTSNWIVNIDSDSLDTLSCPVYASEIFSNFQAYELTRRPSSDYMEKLQRDITKENRAILVDWVVQTCGEYSLDPNTLYLTVYLADQFLSKNKIQEKQLQLLAISCMSIASKYEELTAHARTLQESFFILGSISYSKSEFLQMERQVLASVGYNISVPTIKVFLRRFLRAAEASSKANHKLKHLTDYLAELALMEYSFLKYLPSIIASSAVFLAKWTLDQSTNPWNHTLQHYTWYKSCDIKNCVLEMRELQVNTSNPTVEAIRKKYQHTVKAIRKKYQKHEFSSVASLSSPELPDSLFC